MEDLENTCNICTCMVRSLIHAHLFGSMEEDEECDYNRIFIDDSSAQGGDKEIVVLEKTIQTCARMLP